MHDSALAARGALGRKQEAQSKNRAGQGRWQTASGVETSVYVIARR